MIPPYICYINEKKMSYWKGKKVLITGGASGIGKVMVETTLGKGAQVFVLDRDATALDRLLEENQGKSIIGLAIDITNSEQVYATAQALIQEHGAVDILINNAGIIVGKYFSEHSAEEIDRTMAVNTTALMHMASAFLPSMVENGFGHICNVASSAGLTSNPKMSVYVGSKWAVVGWSDSLFLEMKLSRSGVGVTTVTPYYISTGMFDGVKSPIVPILKPEKVSKAILDGIEKRKRFVSMPWSVRFVRLAQAILPASGFDLVVGRWLGVYDTMTHFSGRKN